MSNGLIYDYVTGIYDKKIVMLCTMWNLLQSIRILWLLFILISSALICCGICKCQYLSSLSSDKLIPAASKESPQCKTILRSYFHLMKSCIIYHDDRFYTFESNLLVPRSTTKALRITMTDYLRLFSIVLFNQSRSIKVSFPELLLA